MRQVPRNLDKHPGVGRSGHLDFPAVLLNLVNLRSTALDLAMETALDLNLVLYLVVLNLVPPWTVLKLAGYV